MFNVLHLSKRLYLAKNLIVIKFTCKYISEIKLKMVALLVLYLCL